MTNAYRDIQNRSGAVPHAMTPDQVKREFGTTRSRRPDYEQLRREFLDLYERTPTGGYARKADHITKPYSQEFGEIVHDVFRFLGDRHES